MGSVIDIAFHQGDLIVLLRLLIAALTGAVIGWNRFRAGKPAGVGTHALVALGVRVVVVRAEQERVDRGPRWVAERHDLPDGG